MPVVIIFFFITKISFAQDFLKSPWFSKKEREFLQKAYHRDYLNKKFEKKLQHQGQERMNSILLNSARIQKEYDEKTRFSSLLWPKESDLIKFRTIELEMELSPLGVP